MLSIKQQVYPLQANLPGRRSRRQRVYQAISAQSAVLGARYGLRATDATHLATAIRMGAHRFITNNSKYFDRSIEEIEVTFPADLPDPG